VKKLGKDPFEIYELEKWCDINESIKTIKPIKTL
jgi:hypothetical protein